MNERGKKSFGEDPFSDAKALWRREVTEGAQAFDNSLAAIKRDMGGDFNEEVRTRAAQFDESLRATPSPGEIVDRIHGLSKGMGLIVRRIRRGKS